MTTRYEQLRAVLLAVVMVASVMTVATPTALAATTAGETTVSVSPADASVESGETTTFDIVVDTASGGVGAYNVSLAVESDTAEITDYRFGGDPFNSRVDTAEDNSSITFTAFGANTSQTGAVTIATVTVEGDGSGSTPVDLTVNALGDEDWNSYSVTGVNSGELHINSPPSATVTTTPSEPGVNETVTADASGSSDSDGQTESFRWYVDGERQSDASGPLFNTSFANPGNHTISVEVIDDDNASANASSTVRVVDRSSPTAIVELDPPGVTVGREIRLIGNYSDDNVGVDTYDWTVTAPDGTQTRLTGAAPTFIPEQPGEHNVSLTVADSAGNTDTTTATFTAQSPANVTVEYELENVTDGVLPSNKTLGVVATVENTGDESDTETVSLVIDGKVLETSEVSVAGDSSETVRFTRELAVGDYTVTVNQLPEQEVSVRKPADVTTEYTVTPTQALTSDAITVTATLENVGGIATNKTVTLRRNGAAVDNQTVRVGGGETVSVEFIERFGTVGEYTLSINDKSPTTVTINRSTNPGAATTIEVPDRGTVLNGETLSVDYSITSSDGITQAVYRVDNGSWTTIENGLTETSVAVNISTLTEGEHTISVALVDNLDNYIGTSTQTFTVDRTAPDISTMPSRTSAVSTHNPLSLDISVEEANFDLDPAFPTQAPVTVTIDSADGTEVFRGLLTDSVADGEVTVPWDTTYQSNDTAVPSGTYTISVEGTDAAGNSEEVTQTISVDNDAPSTTVDSVEGGVVLEDTRYVNSSESLTISGSVSDDETDVASVTILAESTTSLSSSETTVTVEDDGIFEAEVSLEDVPDGSYEVSVVAVDAAGNTQQNQVSDEITLDTSDPTLGASLAAVNASTGRVTVTADEALTSAPTVTVTLPGGSQTDVTVTDPDDDGQYTSTFTLQEDGQYVINASARDKAGNAAAASATTNVTTDVEVDENGTVTISNDKSFIELHTVSNNTSGAVASLTTSDTPLAQLSDDLTGAQFIEGELGDSLSENLSYAKIGIPVAQVPGEVNENVTIQRYNETTGEWEVVGETAVETRDGDNYYVLNVTHFSTYGAVLVDDTSPNIQGITEDGETFEYNTDTVTVDAYYFDGETGVNTSAVSVLFDGEPVSKLETVSANVRSDGLTLTATDLAGSGTHNVTVKVVDEAGNIKTQNSTFTVSQDGTAPTLSTAVTNETTIEYGTEAKEVRFNYTDDASGIEASLDSVSVTVNGENKSGEAIIDDGYVSYTIADPESGTTYDITVSVSDRAGNTAELTRELTTRADTNAPVLDQAIFTPEPVTNEPRQFPAGNSRVTTTFEIGDPLSGVDASNISVRFDGESVTDTAVITSEEIIYTAYGLENGTTHTLEATLVDNDGNDQIISETFQIASADADIGDGASKPSIDSVSVSPIEDNEVPAGTDEITVSAVYGDTDGDLSESGITVTYDGIDLTEAATINDGRIQLAIPNPAAGNHTVTITAVDQAGLTQERVIEFTVAQSATGGIGGGGGGGGGGSSGGPPAAVSVIDTSSGVTVNVKDVNPGTFAASLSGLDGSGVSVNELGFEFPFQVGDYRMELTPPTASPQDAPSLSAGDPVAYLRAHAAGLDTAKLSEATLRVSVDSGSLPDGASPEDVTVFRYTDGEWQALETTSAGNGVYVAKTPGFSEFAIGVSTADSGSGTETPSTTATSTPTSTPTEATQTATEPATQQSTETVIPGFSSILAVIALLLAAFLAARREQ